MALLIQDLEELSPAAMDVILSEGQLARIHAAAHAIGFDTVDAHLRCFAGVPLGDASRFLSAREASSFILLLQTLYPV